MQIQLEIAAIVIVVIMILSAIISFTRHLAQLQPKLENTRLTQEKIELEHRFRDITARYDQLLKQIAAYQKSGPLALATRINIENDLLEIMSFLDAEAGAVYIPVRTERTQALVDLVFLSILPMNSESGTLLKQIIPIKSLADGVFRTGEVNVYQKSAQVPSEHFNQADEASGFVTRDAITLPLRNQGNIVGVLQLLNRKEGRSPFNGEDISLVETFTRNLAGKVAEYCNYPDHLSLNGDYA